MPEDYLLKVENATVIKGSKKILEGVSLEIKEGEIFALLGHNGSGKTTLAYAIMGLKGYALDGGRMFYKGTEITGMPINERARLGIGLSWQEPVRFEGITVSEYLSLSAIGKNPTPDMISKYLDLFGLNESLYANRYVDESLSGGERKRVELASLFIGEPELIILDEPDSGLDIESITRLKKTLTKVRERHASLLLITHQEQMAEISDRIAIICNGEIERFGTTNEILPHFVGKCKGDCPQTKGFV